MTDDRGPPGALVIPAKAGTASPCHNSSSEHLSSPRKRGPHSTATIDPQSLFLCGFYVFLGCGKLSFRRKPESPGKCSEAGDPDFRRDDNSGANLIPDTRNPKPTCTNSPSYLPPASPQYLLWRKTNPISSIFWPMTWGTQRSDPTARN